MIYCGSYALLESLPFTSAQYGLRPTRIRNGWARCTRSTFCPPACGTSECFGDYKLSDIGPQEFLGLISNSRLVLTDSFHATVFSILFNKNFWTFGRECGSYNMNSRIITLLQYFDLLDRFVKTDKDCSKKSCRYDLKYEKIELQKVKSISFLKESI